MIEADNKTIWCGGLAEQVTEELLYELFLQAGPLERVRIAKDRDGRPRNYAFITYCHDVSVPYAINLFRGTTLFNKKLTLQSRGPVALLPPPIRCYGPDPNVDFSNSSAVVQKFTDMTENLRGGQFRDGPQGQFRHGQQFREGQEFRDEQQFSDDPMFRDSPSNSPRRGDRGVDSNDKLVMASLQGSWSHRHHPYRFKEQSQNRDYRPRHNDSGRKRDKPSARWRDRRNKNSNYR